MNISYYPIGYIFFFIGIYTYIYIYYIYILYIIYYMHMFIVTFSTYIGHTGFTFTKSFLSAFT